MSRYSWDFFDRLATRTFLVQTECALYQDLHRQLILEVSRNSVHLLVTDRKTPRCPPHYIQHLHLGLTCGALFVRFAVYRPTPPSMGGYSVDTIMIRIDYFSIFSQNQNHINLGPKCTNILTFH